MNDTYWTDIIQPHQGWFDVRLGELWKYRDLVMLFVHRDFVAVYKQTVLGPLWFILQPLFTTIVFTVVFGKVAKISTDGLPQMLFYMAGTVIWQYFASCLTNASGTLRSNVGIFEKVYFPRLAVPLATVFSNLIKFGLQFIFFLAFLFYFLWQGASVKPTIWILYFPLLLLQMAALGLGTGLIISSLTTKYRDLSFLMGFAAQLWMYATPIVFPLSAVPARWRWLVALNPMAPVVETFRYGFLGAGGVTGQQLGVGILLTIGILLAGILIFNRIEKSFVDTV